MICAHEKYPRSGKASVIDDRTKASRPAIAAASVPGRFLASAIHWPSSVWSRQALLRASVPSSLRVRCVHTEGDYSKKAFTVPELIIVIAIIGVIALVVIPKFDDYYSIDLKSAVKTLASDIKYAQTHAISERVRYGLIFDPTNEKYSIYKGSPSTLAEDFLKPGSSLVRRMGSVDIVSASFDGATRVEFNALGIPYNSSGLELSSIGAVILSRSGNVDTVKVTPLTGKVVF